MFRIGDFARLCQVSVKTLHHYDDVGLLHPAQVEENTGYRYYTAEQMLRLAHILTLKDMGFSLEQIGFMLDKRLSQEQMCSLLRARQEELTVQVQVQQERLVRVAQRLEQLEQEGRIGRYQVMVKALPALTVAAVRCIVSEIEVSLITETIQTGFNR